MLDSFRGSVSPQLNASRDYSRQRQMGIGDLLLENRIVFLDGPIHDASANLIVMKLLFLQSENKHQDVHFYINSPCCENIRIILFFFQGGHFLPNFCEKNRRN